MAQPKAIFAGLMALADNFEVEPEDKDSFDSMREFLRSILKQHGALITNQQGKEAMRNAARKAGLHPYRTAYDKLFPPPPTRSRVKNTIVCDETFQKLVSEASKRKLSYWGYGGKGSNTKRLKKESDSFEFTEFSDSPIRDKWDDEVSESISYQKLFETKNYESYFGSAFLNTQKVHLFDEHISKSVKNGKLDFYNLKWYFDGIALLCQVINKHTFLKKVEIHLFTQQIFVSRTRKKALEQDLIDLFQIINSSPKLDKINLQVHLLPYWEFKMDRHVLTGFKCLEHHGFWFRQPHGTGRKNPISRLGINISYEDKFRRFIEKKLGSTIENFFGAKKPETADEWLQATEDYFYNSGPGHKFEETSCSFAPPDIERNIRKEIPKLLKESNNPRWL
jgi:hypothetical protein